MELKFEMFYKMKIDGKICDWIEEVIKMWLEENVLKIVKIEFDIII